MFITTTKWRVSRAGDVPLVSVFLPRVALADRRIDDLRLSRNKDSSSIWPGAVAKTKQETRDVNNKH